MQQSKPTPNAEHFPAEDLLRGILPPVAPHEATCNSVWVEVDGQVECIRYYAAGPEEGGTASAVIYLHGDRLWGDAPISYTDNTAHQQQDLANAAHRSLGLPFILLARPGTYGSSGCHAQRRTMREMRVVNAAVRAIRSRYGIARTSLAGQSGGAAVAAYVMTQQSNLHSVVLTSGALSMRVIVSHDPMSIYDTKTTGLYDAVAHVAEVAANPGRRLLVIASEGDRFSPPVNQKEYAEALALNGHDVRFMWGEGAGEHRHTLDRTGWAAAAWCLDGVASSEIARRLQAGEVRG